MRSERDGRVLAQRLAVAIGVAATSPTRLGFAPVLSVPGLLPAPPPSSRSAAHACARCWLSSGAPLASAHASASPPRGAGGSWRTRERRRRRQRRGNCQNWAWDRVIDRAAGAWRQPSRIEVCRETGAAYVYVTCTREKARAPCLAREGICAVCRVRHVFGMLWSWVEWRRGPSGGQLG